MRKYICESCGKTIRLSLFNRFVNTLASTIYPELFSDNPFECHGIDKDGWLDKHIKITLCDTCKSIHYQMLINTAMKYDEIERKKLLKKQKIEEYNRDKQRDKILNKLRKAII